MRPETARAIQRRNEVLGAVKRALIDGLDLELEPDEIADDGALFGFGLGLDSIDALSLLVAIEDRFDVRIPEGDLRVFRSPNAIADFVQQGGWRDAS